MKLSFLAAAALTAAATFIPAPCQSKCACDRNYSLQLHVKAGMPAPRAVVLAANLNPALWQRSEQPAHRLNGSRSNDLWRNADLLRWSTSSAAPAKPRISKEEMAKIRS